jgi:hypothetical protein
MSTFLVLLVLLFLYGLWGNFVRGFDSDLYDRNLCHSADTIPALGFVGGFHIDQVS